MLQDFLDLKVINEDKCRILVDDFKKLGFNCEVFVSNVSKCIVFRLNEDLSLHDDFNSFFTWLKPVIEEVCKSINNEEKKSRQLRSMLLQQCELVSASFGKEIYTFSLGRRDS